MATPAGLALQPDSPAMHLDQPLGDGQPQSRALAYSLGGHPDLVKTFKNCGLVFERNTDAGIDYRKRDPSVAANPTDRNRACLRRELDGVSEQIGQDLFESYPVGH